MCIVLKSSKVDNFQDICLNPKMNLQKMVNGAENWNKV